MVRRPKAAEPKPAAPPAPAGPRIRGDVVHIQMGSVRPNTWNPNRMPPHKMASIVHGLKVDGWLASQALLVWATDEKGQRRDVIIDGEHRWRAAASLEMAEAPAVLLEGITEAQAKALTIKMNQKRGEFDPASLGQLLKELEFQVPQWADDMALELAFKPEDLSALLAADAQPVAGPANPPKPPTVPEGHPTAVQTTLPSGLPATANKLVQVHMNGPQFAKFEEAVRILAARHKTTNISDTVFAVILDAAGIGRDLPPYPAAKPGARRGDCRP